MVIFLSIALIDLKIIYYTVSNSFTSYWDNIDGINKYILTSVNFQYFFRAYLYILSTSIVGYILRIKFILEMNFLKEFLFY